MAYNIAISYLNHKGSDNMRLRIIRKRVGLTQTELANLIGVGQPTVALWESGKRNPSNKNLLALSEVLKCTTDELLKAG